MAYPYFATCLFALVFFLSPLPVLAHISGVSFERQSGEYLADIGYDPAALVVGATQVFDFSLIKNNQIVEVESIWVRILQGKETRLATGVSMPAFGKPTLLFVFPNPGAYSLEASFRNQSGEELAKVTFPMSVASDESDKERTPLWLYFLLFSAGAGAGYLVGYARRT